MIYVPAPPLGKTIINACKQVRNDRQRFTWDIIAKQARNAVMLKEWQIRPIYKKRK